MVAAKNLMRLIVLLALLIPTLASRAGHTLLDETTRDWSEISVAAESAGLMVAILVTSEDCVYCVLLKKEVLLPMMRNDGLGSQILLRELSLYTGGKLVDFDGEKVRARVFLRRYGVFATPTLLILNAAGEALHKPLVGYKGAGAYHSLLNQALTQSAGLQLGNAMD